jgi:hypothetical protein
VNRVDEERIKSALEIAMERISALPELTPEEVAMQKEREFGPKGESIAASFMDGLLAEEDLAAELDKYRMQHRQIVRRTLIASLCRTLQVDASLISVGKALAGLNRLVPEMAASIEKAAAAYQAAVHEFDQARQKQSDAMTKAVFQTLGVSGTAVRCNPSDNILWLEEMKRLRLVYEPKLEILRASLLNELTAS